MPRTAKAHSGQEPKLHASFYIQETRLLYGVPVPQGTRLIERLFVKLDHMSVAGTR